MADELRQGLNKVDVAGVVKEHKLKNGKGDNGRYINGSLVIKTGEFSEVTVKVMVNEKNSKGDVKKAYETLSDFINGKLKTLAEVSEEEATKVSIWGKGDFTPKFKEEMFKPEGAPEVKTMISIDLGFGNLNVKNTLKPEEYKAKFDIEMFVNKVEEESINDEETGRVIVKGWTPVYGGSVIPLSVVCGTVVEDGEEVDFAEDVRSGVDEETTVNFWGDIDFRKIVEVVKKGGSLGKAKTEEQTTYINDLVATGAEFIDGDDAYELEDIQKAMAERESKLQEVANKSDSDEGKKNKGLNRENRVARGGKASGTTSGTTTEGKTRARF